MLRGEGGGFEDPRKGGTWGEGGGKGRHGECGDGSGVEGSGVGGYSLSCDGCLCEESGGVGNKEGDGEGVVGSRRCWVGSSFGDESGKKCNTTLLEFVWGFLRNGVMGLNGYLPTA